MSDKEIPATAYWTGLRLAPRASVLLRQYSSLSEENIERFRIQKANFELLPHSLGGMSYSFFEYVQIQAELVATRKPEKELLVLSSDEVNPLAYMLDAFLDHARRVANATIFYLSVRYKRSFPSSMNELVKQLEIKRNLLPNERDLLQDYWKQVGLKVKHYRDLIQHHALLASDCRLFCGADGHPGIYLVIPNNPEIKSVSKLSYENPTIHVFLFMRNAFFETIKFVNKLTNSLLDPSQPANVASLGPNIRTPITLGGKQEGVKIARIENIDSEIRALLGGIN